MQRKAAENDRLRAAREAAEQEQRRRFSTVTSHPGWNMFLAKMEMELQRAEERRDAERHNLTEGPSLNAGPHWDIIARQSYVAAETRLAVLREIVDFVTQTVRDGERPT